MKLTYQITINIIVTAILCIFVWYLSGMEASQVPVKVPDRPPSVQTAPERVIMSIRELQTALNEKGHSRYSCEVDGRMGKETLKAWSNWICDRQARKEFE